MTILESGRTGSLQDRLVLLALAMITATLITAALAGTQFPAMVPAVLEAFAILILAASLAAAKWDFRRDAVMTTVGSTTSIAGILFFGFTLASCLFSHNRLVSIQGALVVGVGVLLYFVVSLNVRAPHNISRLMVALTVVALAGSLYGCIQYGANPDGQATCLFGDHQLYGSFLMILLPFVVMSAISHKALNKKIMSQSTAVVCVVALLLAHSRSAWMGSGIALICLSFLVASLPKERSVEPEGLRRFMLPGLLSVTGLMFLALCLPVSESLLSQAYTLANNSRKDTSIDRQQAWQGTLKMIADHPITGIGASMYVYSHFPYTGMGTPIGATNPRPTLSDQAHNLYLQTAAEIGVPGAAALVAILISFWIAGIRRLKSMDRSDRRFMLMAALSATTAFAVDAFASPSWQFGQIMILFWLSLGAGVACLRQTSQASVRRSVNMVSIPIWFRRPAAAVGLLTLACLMPAAVVASTRMNSLFPSTVYAPVSGKLHGNSGTPHEGHETGSAAAAQSTH